MTPQEPLIDASNAPVLEVRGLTVAYRVGARWLPVVRDFSLSLLPGESHGLVGESGCGKSTVALAIMQWLGSGGRILAGELRLKGQDLRALSGEALRRIRGAEVAMIYQEPMASLNPTMRIGEQLSEVPRYHEGVAPREASERARAMLNRVQLRDDRRIMRAYPHELSGGQQQRIVIAMALLSNPSLLLLDEPTTALDVTVEAGIVDLVAGVSAELGMSMLYISHNLALLRSICQRITVMFAGEVVEVAPTAQLFGEPRHAYTRQLLAAIPQVTEQKRARPLECDVRAPGRIALEVQSLTKTYGSVAATDRVSFEVPAGETVALVGESGSGKSTVARILMGLTPGTSGSAKLEGLELAQLPVKRRRAATLRALQMIFQNPFDTLNPSHSVGAQIARVIRKFHIERDPARTAARVRELLARVQLPPEIAARRPQQLSGGQKQRVAIARAFAGQPRLVVADEPVSALDVSVQAAVVALLLEIQGDSGTTLLFISHDLALVRNLADRVVVMYRGRVVEQGSTEEVFSPPYHPYTEALLAAIPIADPRVVKRTVRVSGDLPSESDGGVGCCFAARCGYRIRGVCETQEPPLQEFATGHRIACHLPAQQLAGMAPIFEVNS